MKPIIDETHPGYIVTLDRDAKPKLRKPPRILSRDELPTDEELFCGASGAWGQAMKMDELLLIDLGSMFWRRWFTSRSQVTTLVEVVNRIEFLASQYEYLVVCADSPSNWRYELTDHLERESQYKANRPRKDPEAVLTLTDTEERLAELGYPVARCDGYEADDVIATLVKQSDCQTYIHSDDKDLFQLISPRVTQLTHGGEMDPDACVRKFGVPPRQMRELIAITGDGSDNISGCPRVGPGKAALLLRAFGSVEGIKAADVADLLDLPGIGPAVASSIEDWDPKLAMELVRLADDCPVNLQELVRDYSPQKLDDEITLGGDAA